LKDYLNRFWALTDGRGINPSLTVRHHSHDEDMIVTAFEQGIAIGLFSDLLIRNQADTFFEIRQQVVVHINTEDVVATKHGSSFLRHPKPKERSRARPLRVNGTSGEKRMDSRYAPYATKRNEPKTKARGESEFRPKFRVSYKELLGMPGEVDKLKFPQKTDRNLGSRKDVWCEFHKGFGHNVERA